MPTPSTPLADGSFAFENDKEIPKTPLARSPSFFSKNSEQKKKVHDREFINKLEEEGQRIRGKVEQKRNFEDSRLEDYQLKEGETRTYLSPKSTQVNYLLPNTLDTYIECTLMQVSRTELNFEHAMNSNIGTYRISLNNVRGH